MAQKFSSCKAGTKASIIIGFVLIAIGSLGLVEEYGNVAWWRAAVDTAWAITGYIVPIALIVLGIYLVWAARHDKLDGIIHGTHEQALRRSATDKRFAGVCGGIAQYFKVDSMLVRVVVLVLFVAAPLPVLVAYVLLAVILPQT